MKSKNLLFIFAGEHAREIRLNARCWGVSGVSAFETDRIY